jgi:D-3-phosphoglycerate dehydrogenase
VKIAFLDTVHEVLQLGFEELGHVCDDLTSLTKESIEEIIDGYDGIVVRSRFPMNQEFLSRATELKFIARSGAGMENIDIPYCESRNIELFSAPEGNRNAVAEHALGMILSLFNRINFSDQEVRKGKWDREGNRGIELDGKTVGIIGFGNNGSQFANKLRGFDVSVLAYDKYKNGFGDNNVQEVTLDYLKSNSDIISLHIPQNEETLRMIDSKFIKEIVKDFYLINLSRGKIVVTDDLIDGLERGKVLGACLDVLEYEKSSFEEMFKNEVVPTGFKKLINSDKVILSPHVGGWTTESYYKLSQVLLRKFKTKFHV